MPSIASVPSRFDGLSFEEYKPASPSAEKAKAAAERFVAGEIDGLVLSGPTGVGKSHLAAALVSGIRIKNDERYEADVERLRTDKPGWVPMRRPDPSWLNAADTIAGMRLEMDLPYDDRPRTHALLAARDWPGVVILDDLGREKVSDWTGEQIYALVNSRYEEGLRTVVTTNLTGEELAASPYWPIISRLAEDGALVRIDAPDYRLVKNGRRLSPRWTSADTRSGAPRLRDRSEDK